MCNLLCVGTVGWSQVHLLYLWAQRVTCSSLYLCKFGWAQVNLQLKVPVLVGAGSLAALASLWTLPVLSGAQGHLLLLVPVQGHLQGSKVRQDLQARDCPNTVTINATMGPGQPMSARDSCKKSITRPSFRPSITAPMLVAWPLQVPVKQPNRGGGPIHKGKRPDVAQDFTQWRGSAGGDARC